MNDQLLRERLDGAVAGIRTTSRLDEILAGPPGGTVPSPSPSRQPPRRITLIAAAAALIALAAFAAGWAVRSADDGTTRLEIQPVTTTAGSTTAADGARIGDHLTLSRDALPPDLQLVDETFEASADAFTASVRLAPDDEQRWTGDGPYVRVNVAHAPAFGTQWKASTTGEPTAPVSGHAAFRTAAPVGLGAGWVSLGWATGPDEVIEVQAKGVDDATLAAIARSVQINP